MRRSFYVLIAFFGLLVLSPLFVVTVVIIKLHDNGPILYRGTRVGIHGRIFKLFKFRTMDVQMDQTGAGITNANDKRITSIGRFLRRYKIDELPQLINIIRGEMNLVGPRPEDPRYTALYNEGQKKIFGVRPGITSPASLYYRDEASLLVDQNWEEKYIKEIMPEKLSIDIKYFESNTFWSDCGIIFKTIISVCHFKVVA